MRKLFLAIAAALILSLQPRPAAAIGGPSNIVIVTNHTDGRLVIRGSAQLTREPGMIAAPQNSAFASSSCTDCQTVAIALQLNFADEDNHYFSPQNFAVATNEGCVRCVTVARAYQVTLQTSDPNELPDGVRAAMADFDATLRDISTDPTMTLEHALPRIEAVITEFWAYATKIDAQESSAE
jgi:hypothetical protein